MHTSCIWACLSNWQRIGWLVKEDSMQLLTFWLQTLKLHWITHTCKQSYRMLILKFLADILVKLTFGRQVVLCYKLSFHSLATSYFDDFRACFPRCVYVCICLKVILVQGLNEFTQYNGFPCRFNPSVFNIIHSLSSININYGCWFIHNRSRYICMACMYN